MREATTTGPGANALGLLVGGYSDGAGTLYEVTFPSREVALIANTAGGGAAWRGQTDVVVRLMKGVISIAHSERRKVTRILLRKSES